MKRSEMVNHIHSFVQEQLLYSNTFNVADSEQLLWTLEQAGMLPPSTKLEHINTADNSWEPEKCDACSVPCNKDWCCTKDVK